ncbi:MAG: hypothetical protein JSW66_04830 [Phycisphaerales bacterium]|nr:MAG: hypothetical protein JSW66_04830 [Phycisphaerales bacterium]
MLIAQANKEQIEQIIKEMDCPRDFECYKSDFENLCDVGIVGDAKMVECIEEDAHTCTFGVPFGRGVLCKCPLRNYIAKHFTR